MVEEKKARLFFPALIFLITIFLLVAAGFRAEAKKNQSRDQGSKPAIVVGIAFNGKFAFAEMMKNSFEMALEAVNGQGGIKGSPLELVYADDGGKPEAGEKAVRQLIRKKGAVMLVGGYSSSNTVYMAGMAEKMDRPFLISTAADDRITQRKWKNVYRLNPPASGYTQGLEDFFLKEIQPKSIAIVYENSPYGTSGALRMMWFCRENGIDIKEIIPYHRERIHGEYHRRILSPLKEEPPDVIYMISYLKDGAALVKEIRRLGVTSLLTGGAGGFTHPDFITMAGEAGNHLLTATLWFQEIPFPGVREYYEAYRKRYGTAPDYHAAEAYSALLVAADALRRADDTSPGAIRAALDGTNLLTPFGPVKFTSYEKFERQNSMPTQVLQVQNGKIECVWPRDLATATFVSPSDWRKDEKR